MLFVAIVVSLPRGHDQAVFDFSAPASGGPCLSYFGFKLLYMHQRLGHVGRNH